MIDFILYVLYNRPRKEKTPGDSHYAMKISGKGKKRKFTQSQRLPPDRKSMQCHIQRANFVVNCMVDMLRWRIVIIRLPRLQPPSLAVADLAVLDSACYTDPLEDIEYTSGIGFRLLRWRIQATESAKLWVETR